MSNVSISTIRRRLKKENLFVRTTKDAFGAKAYMVVDANNVLQTSEQGMTFDELVAYTENMVINP